MSTTRPASRRFPPLFVAAGTLLALPVAFPLHARAQTPKPAQPRIYDPAVEVPKALAKMTPEERRASLRRMADAGFFPVDAPELWEGIDKPETLGMALRLFGEPYTLPVLDAIERLLLPAPDWSVQNTGAILLYRYGRAPGEKWLADALTAFPDKAQSGHLKSMIHFRPGEGEAYSAATIFARNREVKYLGPILAYLDAGGHAGSELLELLGEWPHREIEARLAELYLRAPLEPGSGNLIWALARQKTRRPEVLRLIHEEYAAPREGFADKIYLVGVLAHLEEAKRAERLRFLFALASAPRDMTDRAGTYTIPPFPDPVDIMPRAARNTDGPAAVENFMGDPAFSATQVLTYFRMMGAVPHLQKPVRDLLRRHSFPSPGKVTPPLKPYVWEGPLTALEGLTQLAQPGPRPGDPVMAEADRKATAALAGRMLALLDTGKAPEDALMRTARCALTLGVPVPAVEKALGKRWTTREIAKRKLRPVGKVGIVDELYWKDRP